MPHTPLARAFRRPWPGTRRGLILWFFSLTYIYFGAINYIATTPPPLTREALSFPFDIAPPHVWGFLIITLATVALITSYCHFGRDKHGFKILSVFAAVWGTCYICGYFFYDASLRATSGSVTWFLFSAILLLTSGLPSTPPRRGYPTHCAVPKEE